MVDLKVTEHAAQRMAERCLGAKSLEAALSFGREIHTRGVTIFVIGRKEVRKAAAVAADISRFEGLHVLCSREGNVVTTYRNFDLRGLKPRTRTRTDRYLRAKLAA